MPDQTTHLSTLFKTDLIHVFDYRCAGHTDAQGEITQGFEIVLPRSGCYLRKDAHGTFLADPNQVLFFNKGEPYDIQHVIQGGDASTIFVLAPTLIIEMMRARDPGIENHPHRIFQRSHITFDAHLQILQYWLLQGHKNYTDLLGMEEQIVHAVSEIVQVLYQVHPARNHPSTSSHTSRVHAEQMHAVRTFLNRHFRTPLQLEQISSAVHLSPYHLCRVFKQNTGMTLHQYIQRLRLFNAAEEMLENPRARLDTFAFDYGFSNHGHFSTSFRQTFGINPSELRRAHLRQMSKNLKA